MEFVPDRSEARSPPSAEQGESTARSGARMGPEGTDGGREGRKEGDVLGPCRRTEAGEIEIIT